MPPDTERLAARIAGLEQELVGIDGVIRAARQAFDADAWMRSTMRADELPVLIREARAEQYGAQLEDAWAAVDTARAAEAKLLAVYDQAAANPDCQPVHERIPGGGLSPTAYAEMQAATTMAGAHREEALRRLQQAKMATDLAFDAVEQIELSMDGAGIDAPVTHSPRPRPVARTVLVSAGQSAPQLTERLIHEQGGVQVATLTAGMVPPRWLAHRLSASHFPDEEQNDA